MSARGTNWLTLFNREPWQADALCRQVDQGDVFFPEAGGSPRDAKVICRECPVIEECLDFALRFDIPHGVFGGRSERERWRLKRGQDVPFRVPGERERPINECKECGEPFTGRGKYCDEFCRRTAAASGRQRRHQAAVDEHTKKRPA